MSEDFENLHYQLYLAYYAARKNKRNTINQLKFEVDLEQNLYKLAKQIITRQYTPKPSIAFMVFKPVKREIFAADFVDRVVHHLLYKAIYSDIEKILIHDTYSCRKNKGTLYGIKRMQKFMRSCTENYQKQAYVLKLDIKGYFMHMHHQIIYEQIISVIKNHNLDLELSTLDYLLKKVIFNDVTQNCRIKGSKKDWVDLPHDKSLFGKPGGVGLPIGNLTSQMFGNLYLNELDHFIKQDLDIKYYGRYVDDMVFMSQDQNKLKTLIPKVNASLNKVGLVLHPKKIYMQSIDKGFLFLGQYIKPYRSYISNRTKHNFYQALGNACTLLFRTEAIAWNDIKSIQSTINSYLGILRHANAFNLMKHGMQRMPGRFYCFFRFVPDRYKIYINQEFWQWHYSLTYQSTN